ncbi:MAG TPA: hypothetical protein VLF91_04005 [Candidatus Saccharimonadales bacterium]|nr:hypothetical protein [Candidatus Saccharimonadales bacterium]
MTREVGIDIAPYLNPDYWGGHTLGVGPTEETTLAHFPSREERRFAEQAMRAGVRGRELVPLHTFYAGDTFNPGDHRPGTVVLFRQERLLGEHVATDYSLDELRAQPLPVRQTTTSPAFGVDTPVIIAKDGKRHYMNQLRWGVIPEKYAGYIFSVAALGVFDDPRGARVLMPWIDTETPINIGEVQHTARRRVAASDYLRRINVLHIVTSGAPETRRGRKFRFLPRPLSARPVSYPVARPLQ